MDFERVRARARRRLPKILYEFVDGGACSETTFARNTSDLNAVQLRQRVLRDVSKVDTEIELFGRTFSMPVGLSAVGLAGMLARRGEVQAVRAATRAKVPFILSTQSVCSIEEVADAAEAPFWFQCYLYSDRPVMDDIVGRAAAAGCEVLVLTVDNPVAAPRYRGHPARFSRSAGGLALANRMLDELLHPRWLADVYLRGRPHSFGNFRRQLTGVEGLEGFGAWRQCNTLGQVTWDDLSRLRDSWTGKLVIKGVLDVEDALRAAKAGVDGLTVSNHGGRQLDGAPSAISVLSGISAAVGDRLVVMMDGGIRSGVDAIKACALGARAGFMGRGWAFALAAGGESGVAEALSMLRSEVASTLALCGLTRLADLDHQAVHAIG